ncbi:GAF domain-containing protein [Candidatus Micrarchaeota archaeon]|nr:GAF domain-containing protein [Candidatus Micrarchaeota archaeon]
MDETTGPGANTPQVRREVQELALLFEISQKLDKSPDLSEALAPVLEAMAEFMGMLRGTITLVNRETGEILIEVGHGLSEKQKERGRYVKGEGVTGKVIQSGQPAVAPRISEDPIFLDRTGARKGVARKDISFICVPIKIGNEVVGALSADKLFQEKAPLKEDVRLLSIIASMISQAVKLRRVTMEERTRLMEENARLQNQLREKFQPSNIIGRSKTMQKVYDLIAQVSKSDATVLIRGESGTGKELVANAIHYNSLRADKPFIKVNCGALPESVVESELFGHEKGAFTGALAGRKGRFELAQGGTIFLDEVGDLTALTQVKLLRVLQEKEFERVGGVSTIKCDVRVIAATNKNLETLIEAGMFRQDLYYRLHVFPVHVPSLRERKTDIPLLVDHFVEKASRSANKKILRVASAATDALMAYHWPGNVRELENVIERAVLLSTDGVVHSHLLPTTLQTTQSAGITAKGNLRSMLAGVERDLIHDALKAAGGNKAKAARALGISERIMGLRVEKYKLDTKNYRT